MHDMNTKRQPKKMETCSSGPGLRILIVENHPDTLEALRLYLEDLGHGVQTARNVSEALNVTRSSEFEVLISDIGLPDGSGWELLEKARLPRHVIAIAMSGFGMNADSARSRAAGYRHHLLKPFKTGELDKILEEATALTAHS
jgi:CheY-like chemotaxis protein